jgi:hypothetical protein
VRCDGVAVGVRGRPVAWDGSLCVADTTDSVAQGGAISTALVFFDDAVLIVIADLRGVGVVAGAGAGDGAGVGDAVRCGQQEAESE